KRKRVNQSWLVWSSSIQASNKATLMMNDAVKIPIRDTQAISSNADLVAGRAWPRYERGAINPGWSGLPRYKQVIRRHL
ncbi:3943_t:CDS:1, partial [Paraglomus occultum]